MDGKNLRRFYSASHAIALLFAVLTIAAPTNWLHAQPNLNFKRVTVNWPTIELYFSVGCNGNPAYNMAKQDFKIFENGVEVKDFTLWCPDPTARCAISVSLVFDASGSMSGSGNAGAKLAGHAFIDLMDGVLDEAAVIWFNSAITVYQQMTTIKPMLHSAVDALPAGGATAAWNGIYAGIIELINNGVNQCRAVIVLTDGEDNASTRTVAEIISLANRHRIRIFTVGLGSFGGASDLEQIALLTGGRYYQTPNAGQLEMIYQEISTIIFQGFQECIITYERDCADGAMRTVELQLQNFCGGTDVKTKTYRAPLDSTTFSDLHMRIGDVTVGSKTDIKVPLNLVTPIADDMFYPFTFTLQFDTQCLSFKGVATSPGSLLAGVPITVTPVPGGVQIATNDRKLLNGSGMLMEFTFHASNPQDTSCCDVWAVDPVFERGCFIPIIAQGEVCIIPQSPIIFCTIDAPREVIWQRSIKDYTPNPFPVTMRIFNTGEEEAKNVRFKIDYDTADIRLVSPLSDVQAGSPRDLAPGGYSDVIWQVAAKRRTSGDSTLLCITASFDNHPDVDCCIKTYIPPTEPILECMIDAPAIVADHENARYVPMPFPVTVTVTNTGGMRTDSVFATIALTGDLTLGSGEQATKRVLPTLLLPNLQGQTQWMLVHPPTTVEKQYVLQIWVRTANADSTLCEKTIIIPPLLPTFHFTLDSSGGLTFCEGGSVTLSAPDSLASYFWSTGNRLRTLLVTKSGLYHCRAEASDGRIGYSDTIRVTVHPNPAPRITAAPGLTVCEGDTVLLDAGAGYVSYLWNTGDTVRMIRTTQPGTYFVDVVNQYGCPGYSDTVTVVVLPRPAQPVITRSGDMLTTTISRTYQWYRDNVALPGGSNQFLYVPGTGVYSVRVTNEYGCSSVSAPFDVSVLDVADSDLRSALSVNIYPDPASDFATIEVTVPSAERIRIWLFDPLGRGRQIAVHDDGPGNYRTQLRMEDLPSGVYHITVSTPTRVIARRFVKF